MRTSIDTDDDQAITERFLAIGAAVILLIAGLAASLQRAESGENGGGDDSELNSEARGEPDDDPSGRGAEAQPDGGEETPATSSSTSSTSVPASFEEVAPDCSQDTTVGQAQRPPPEGIVVLYLSDSPLPGDCTFNASVTAPPLLDLDPAAPPSRLVQIESVNDAFTDAKGQACESLGETCKVKLLVVGRGARGSVLAAHWACEEAEPEATSVLFLSSLWAASYLDCQDQTFEIVTVEIDPMRPTSHVEMIDSVDDAIAELQRK